jgi:hypothetical protein
VVPEPATDLHGVAAFREWLSQAERDRIAAARGATTAAPVAEATDSRPSGDDANPRE